MVWYGVMLARKPRPQGHTWKSQWSWDMLEMFNLESKNTRRRVIQVFVALQTPLINQYDISTLFTM